MVINTTQKNTPRIGKKVAHADFINKEIIHANFSPCRHYRYTLTFQFTGGLFGNDQRTKHLVIILKNPSSASEENADNTIRRIQEYVYFNFPKVGTLTILNLFGICGTDPKDVVRYYKENDEDPEVIIGPKNDTMIAETVSKADIIIYAWGGRSQIPRELYDSRIDEVRDLVNVHADNKIPRYRIIPPTDRGSEQYPFHACFWSNTYAFVLTGKTATT